MRRGGRGLLNNTLAGSWPRDNAACTRETLATVLQAGGQVMADILGFGLRPNVR